MAYAALDSIAKKLDRILDHNYDRYYCLFLRNKQEIQSLHENVISMLDFVECFPGEVGNFEARITNAAKQAKATFEKNDRLNHKNDPKCKLAGQMLDQLIDEIDSILKEATLLKRGNTARFGCFAPKGKETILGFEKELLEIKGRLFSELSQLETIPIVGMGGIGKTTLARYVYNDTIHHFDVRAWVTVSQNSNATTILSSLLSSIDPSKKKEYQCMNMELLVQHGHRYLKKRRYLIVMDDMWDTDVWDDVRMSFPDDCNGSRIVITTRSLDVASYVDSSNQPHLLQLMSKAQSWRLLKEVVFGHEDCPDELEETGRLIAEKCRGLPLAIVVIAGVLSKLSRVQESWERIASNVSEAVNTSGDEVLSVSYMHLPLHLRPCFLYMGCFPEDYEINVSKLIRLWVGEGFLISNDSKDMEELGYEYLDDLAKRSLVLIEKKRYNGKMKAVKIHDLLRDLCLRKSRDENFLHLINEFSGSFPHGIENSHRLSICSNVWGCFPNMDRAPIHTILIFFRHWAFDYWKNFRLLKVLDATTVALESFGAEITELIHLRYLALAFENHRKDLCLEVPESLSKLQSLQTLIITRLRDNFGFKTILPIAIWRMPQLRHIMLLNGSLPENFHEALPLGSLQTLSRIKNFTCSEMMVDMLQNLKKLGISYSDYGMREAGWSQYGLNNLVHLHKLEKINLYVPPYLCSKSDLAQNVAFPVSLRKLTLTGCRLPWEDMTIVGSLPNLEVLKLKREACDGATWETTEGEFCQLKVLLIENTGLHQWIAESSHFPSLERLTLYECNELEEIPSDIGEIPTLQLIEVDVRNSSVVQSARYIQEEQQSFGNELQVSLLKPRSFDWL